MGELLHSANAKRLVNQHQVNVLKAKEEDLEQHEKEVAVRDQIVKYDFNKSVKQWLLRVGDRKSCHAGTDPRIRALILAVASHLPKPLLGASRTRFGAYGMGYGCVAIHHGELEVRDHGFTIMWRLRSASRHRWAGVILQKR